MKSLGQDVCKFLHSLNLEILDQPHCTILDDFVGKLPPDVDLLGAFTSSDDVVS